MSKRLNEEFRPERDDRTFEEKYGEGNYFSESELDGVVPESMAKLFESILEPKVSKKRLLEADDWDE